MLTQSGKADFSVPGNASGHLALLNEGWTPIAGIPDFMKYVKAGRTLRLNRSSSPTE